MWSIGVQREIFQNLAIEASYVGNRGAWWQGNNLIDVNALTAQRIASFGLDVTNPSDQKLLITPWNKLTAAQQAQFDSVQAAFTAKMPAFTPGQAPDPAQMQQRRAMMASQDSSLRNILTPEQQAVWDRNVEQARSMQRRPPGS